MKKQIIQKLDLLYMIICQHTLHYFFVKQSSGRLITAF